MDHIDHAKGNFSNAAEEVLHQKVKMSCEEIKKSINELIELES
jgi:hypothetical protein